jgi:hypothetical protein
MSSSTDKHRSYTSTKSSRSISSSSNKSDKSSSSSSSSSSSKSSSSKNKSKEKDSNESLPYNSIIDTHGKKKYNIYEQENKLVNLKKATYNKNYELCKNLIKFTCKAGERTCIYQIPSYMYGEQYPHVNVLSCAKYIMNKMINWNRHVKVSYEEPNLLIIDWSR